MESYSDLIDRFQHLLKNLTPSKESISNTTRFALDNKDECGPELFVLILKRMRKVSTFGNIDNRHLVHHRFRSCFD